MTDRDLLELIAVQVSKLAEGQTDMKQNLNSIEDKIEKVDMHVLRIENEHGEKLSALFDGYKQNSDQLERIKKAVLEHDEILFKQAK